MVDIEALRTSVRAEIEDAVAFADSSPEPAISTICDDVDSGMLGVQL
jgi:TPP-dependent pyruvate/acetoin dehydrogenase alpha subunit